MNACFINRITYFFFFCTGVDKICQCFPRLGSGLHFVDSTVPSSDYSHEAGEKLPRPNGGKSRLHRLQGQMVHGCKKTALWKVE